MEDEPFYTEIPVDNIWGAEQPPLIYLPLRPHRESSTEQQQDVPVRNFYSKHNM